MLLLLSIFYFDANALTLSDPLFFAPTKKQHLESSNVNYTFSGSGGAIDYINLCIATDNTCATCNSSFATITQGTPIAYSVGGTTYSINRSAIESYINQYVPNPLAGTYFIGMYVQSNIAACNGSSSYCASNQDNGPHFLCIQASTTVSSGHATVTALSQADNGQVELNTPASPNQYAYVTQNNTAQILQCMMNDADGSLNTCTATLNATPLWTSPQGIAFSNATGTQYVYVVDNGVSTAGIYQCKVGNYGLFSDCQNALTDTSVTWSSPYGIQFATVNTNLYAYITDPGTKNLIYCLADPSSGLLSHCDSAATTGASWTNPMGISTGTFSGTSYLYVYDGSNQGAVLNKFTFNFNGSLSSPSVDNEGDATTTNIFVVSSTSSLYEPYPGTIPGGITGCSLNSTGNVNTCTLVQVGTDFAYFTSPTDIALFAVGSNTNAYVTDSTYGISNCSVTTPFYFTACTSTPQQNVLAHTAQNIVLLAMGS